MIDPQEFIAPSSGHAGLVINLSGGKDSTRMLGHVRSLFPANSNLLRHGRHGVRARPTRSRSRVVALHR